MLGATALRSARSLQTGTVDKLLTVNTIARANVPKLAPSVAAPLPLAPLAAAGQVRLGSSGPDAAPWVKNIFKQNDHIFVKPKVDWRNKPEKTDGDLNGFWFFGGLLVLVILSIRFMSILTGGDKVVEFKYRPKRYDKAPECD